MNAEAEKAMQRNRHAFVDEYSLDLFGSPLSEKKPNRQTPRRQAQSRCCRCHSGGTLMHACILSLAAHAAHLSLHSPERMRACNTPSALTHGAGIKWQIHRSLDMALPVSQNTLQLPSMQTCPSPCFRCRSPQVPGRPSRQTSYRSSHARRPLSGPRPGSTCTRDGCHRPRPTSICGAAQ